MQDDPSSLHNISKEVLNEGYVERARQRAQRCKSPWNILLVPLVVGGVAITTYVLFLMMWRVHTTIYPAHADGLGEFWGKGISFQSLVSSFLLAVPLFFAALPVGMLLGNFIAWCIPPARRAFDRESKGVKWTSFRESMSGLWKLSLIVVPVCLLLSFIGAATLRSLR